LIGEGTELRINTVGSGVVSSLNSNLSLQDAGEIAKNLASNEVTQDPERNEAQNDKFTIDDIKAFDRQTPLNPLSAITLH
jgi:hypothetical protein